MALHKTTDAYRATAGVIQRLESGLSTGNPGAKHDLAVLRRAVGRDPGDEPEALGIVCTLLDPSHQGDGYVTDCERAVFAALTLWAYHRRPAAVAPHVPAVKGKTSRTIGHGVGELIRRETGGAYNDHPVRRRWQYAAASDTVGQFAARSRTIVDQLARAGIGFDYADLASSLVHWESRPENRKRALLRWSRGARTGWSSADTSTSTPSTDTDKE